jgi:hypothetical protein
MAGKRVLAATALLCGFVCAAFADTVMLENGVELRNVKVVEETEHTMKINIIGYTNIVVGKSKIVNIEREGGAPIPMAPAPTEPEPGVAEPSVEPAARAEVTSRTAYMVPTDQQNKQIEIVLAALADGTTSVEVTPPPGTPGEKQEAYVVTAEDGQKINVAVERDAYGDVMTMAINPPEPSRTSPQDVFEYTVKSVDGKTFRIKAKWDWNTRTVQDLEFLP